MNSFEVNVEQLRGKLLVDVEKKWFTNDLGERFRGDVKELSTGEINYLKERAESIYQHEVNTYKTYVQENQSRDYDWLTRMIRSGTIADQVSAYILLLQNSVVHNMPALTALVKMVDARINKSLFVAGKVKDLFLDDILPKNRKLVPFEKRPLGALETIHERDVATTNRLLLFWYFEDRLKLSYMTFVSAIIKLTCNAQPVLKKSSVKIAYQLLLKCPEQEQVLLRSITYKIGDENGPVVDRTCELLHKLLDDHPLMKAMVVSEVEQLLFTTKLKPRSCYYAICFLNQLPLEGEELQLNVKLIKIFLAMFKMCIKLGNEDQKMLSAVLSGISRTYPFVKDKLENCELFDHLNDLYRVVQVQSFRNSVQALLVLFHLGEAEKEPNDRFYNSLYRKLLDPEVQRASKPALFISLLWKSLMADTKLERVYAFAKRIFLLFKTSNPELLCALLLTVSVALKENILSKLKTNRELKRTKQQSQTGTNKASRGQGGGGGDEVVVDERDYDPMHRNPLFAHATNSSAWELVNLTRCYHPTVSLFAQTLLDGNAIEYDGDPLHDLTLSRFLDRFVFRNPKKINACTSQRIAKLGRRKFYVPPGMRNVSIAEGTLDNIDVRNVPVDELFLHSYVTMYKLRRNAKDEDVDTASVTSEDFVELLSKYENAPDDTIGEDFARSLTSAFKEEAKRLKKFGKDVEGEDDFGESDVEGSQTEFDDMDEVEEDHGRKKETADDDDDMAMFFKNELEDDDNDEQKGFEEDFDMDDAAEEFSTMLEDNLSSGIDAIGTEAMDVRDKASVRQLKWEKERDRYVRGVDWKSRKGERSRGSARGKGGGAVARAKAFRNNKKQQPRNQVKKNFNGQKRSTRR